MAKKSITQDKRTHTARKDLQKSVNSFQQAMNILFDDFFTNFDLLPLSVFEDTCHFTPRIDMKDHEKDIIVSIELPGIEEDDIDITLSRNTLRITGEKRQPKEPNGYSAHYVECSYGSFQRTISLPEHVDSEKATASFRNGILKITLPKELPERESRRKILIKKG